jgi:3-phosphoshikimate 1-carboxyvinyltransferase
LNTPDLAPALAVVAAGLNIDITLTRLQNLVIKESNRIEALAAELTKCGFNVKQTSDSLSIIQSQILTFNSQISIHTYNDHRMAMAFAPLALIAGEITIEHPEVVEKSYPHFWDDLHKMGFNLKS